MKHRLLFAALWLSKVALAQLAEPRSIPTDNGVIELKHGGQIMPPELGQQVFSQDAKTLLETMEAHPQDFEKDTFWGSGTEKGYSQQPRVKIKVEVFDHTRLAEFYQLKVYIYQASEAEPNPSVLPEHTHSGDWKLYGEVSTNLNPYWIQLPRNHFFRLVIHDRKQESIQVLTKTIHTQQEEKIRYDF